MPFNREGNWTEPSTDDLEKWINDLLESKSEMTELSPDLENFLEQTLNSEQFEFKNIEHLNKVSYQSLVNSASEDSKVSIVMPVYGALHLVKPCVESVLKHTHWPYEFIIVDDKSPDPEVKEYLSSLKDDRIKVLFNKKNKGFAATCNHGARKSTGKYICILNSDVLVTPYWLTKMVAAAEADPSHVIVNPCTNNTALIDVPMQAGKSYLDMNRAMERKSPKNYPEIMPTGFCLFFKRTLFDRLGGFDEGYVSYGEDTHFWFNALRLTDKEGKYLDNKAVMADDCYIFHERSSSFSQIGSAQHMAMRRGGSERFHKLNPLFASWRNNYNVESVMAPLRQPVPDAMFLNEFKYNIAWVVKSAHFCGGMKYITDIANELIEQGVNVKICVIKNSPSSPEVTLNELHTAPIFFESEEDFFANFASRCFTNGFVLAAVSEMVEPVGYLCSKMASLVPIHHVQSYDPLLTEDKVLAQEQAEVYGKLQATICSSNWITDTLTKDHKINNILFNVQPGVDTDIFHKSSREHGDERFTVMVNLDSQYPFKGYDRGVALCKELLKQNPNIRVYGLGVDGLADCPGLIGIGKVSQARLAHLLRAEVDVFVDPSYIHSYGLPSLEALVSGAEVVCWNNMGILEHVNNTTPGVNIFKNDVTPHILAHKILDIQKSGRSIPDVEIISRKESVKKFIDEFELNLNLRPLKKKITVVTPHARKHGGPTTIINLANVLGYLGHEVTLVSIYDDFNPEVINFRHVPLHVGIDNIPESDVVIVNSDNPFVEDIINHPNAKNAKRILLKLSHNPRFKLIEEASLRMPVWDKIITSTEHLREKTINPIEDWKHIAWDEDKVKTVGWYNYTFQVFNTPPKSRVYGEKGITIGYLAHDHPAKGTLTGNTIVQELKTKYGPNVTVVAFGETKMHNKPDWIHYIYKATRLEMATVMRQIDIWLGCSLSEGLGRMTLEAMASGCAVVTTDTGAEFLEDKKNCLLYTPGDSSEGYQAVESIVSDKHLLKKLATNGYETAKASSNPSNYILNIKGVIDGLFKD